MDNYLREPAFWETLDGDINAVPVEQSSGRAVNSDVWALRGMTLAETDLDKVSKTPHANRWRDDYVIYDTQIPAIPRVEVLLRWAEKHRSEVSDEAIEFLLSLTLADDIPHDVDCQSYLNSKDGVSIPFSRWKSDKRMRRGIGFLLWGGDHIINAMASMGTPVAGQETLRYEDGLGFWRVTLDRILMSDWRMDDAVSYREMALLSAALGERFDHGKLLMSEVIYGAAHNRSLLLATVKGNIQNLPEWNALRLDVIEQFRSVSSNDGALLWYSYFDSRIKGLTHVNYKVKRIQKVLDDMLAIASQVSFMDAFPFMESDITDADVIAAAVANAVDIDMMTALLEGGAA